MMQIKQWDIWWASVRFDDVDEIKQRPVIVLSSGEILVIALKVTSQPPRVGDYVLSQWQYAGLYKPSTARLDKLLKLEHQEMKYRMGSLHPSDILPIQKALADMTKVRSWNT